MPDAEVDRPSTIARLLEEISWERATAYRNGGRGRENVLSAEVLMALDYLPREHFLGAVIRKAHGADEGRMLLASEVEESLLDFLPGDLSLSAAKADVRAIFTQPDALITSPSVYLLLEAKRIKSTSFQPKQLAQELLAVVQHASGHRPLILLLGVKPPVLVRGSGRMSISEAVSRHMVDVVKESGNTTWEPQELTEMVNDVFCWISWPEIDGVVRRQAASFHCAESSVLSSVRRLAASINSAIAWHS